MLCRVLVCALLLGLVPTPGCRADWQDSGYPSAGYPSGPYPAAVQPTYATNTYTSGSNCGPGLGLGDVVSDLSNYKNGLLQTGATAAIATLLAKLPALLFIKVFIFKLIVVPMLFLFVAIPVLAPLLMMMMPMMMSMMGMMGDMMPTTTAGPTTTPKPAARALGLGREYDSVSEVDDVLRSLLSSHRCLERVACRLGARDRDSAYRKPVTWLLKQLQAMVPAGYRDRVKLYRQAYMTGAAEGACDQETFPCETPRLLVQQEERTFRIF